MKFLKKHWLAITFLVIVLYLIYLAYQAALKLIGKLDSTIGDILSGPTSIWNWLIGANQFVGGGGSSGGTGASGTW